MEPRVDVYARPAYVVLVIICAMVGIGILVLASMAIMAGSTTPTQTEPNPIVLAIFVGLGAASVSAAVTVRRRFIARALHPAHPPVWDALSGAGPEPDDALGGIRDGVILACALSEVPAVLGLAYVLFGGSTIWTPVFFGGALVSWALSFPRPSEWREWMAALTVSSAQAKSDSEPESAPRSKLRPPPKSKGDGPKRVK